MSKRVRFVGGNNDIEELQIENDELSKKVQELENALLKVEQEKADLKIEIAHLRKLIKAQTIIYPYASTVKPPNYEGLGNA